MTVPDAKTRSTISLNPSKVFSSSYVSIFCYVFLLSLSRRIPSRFLPKFLFSNACFVFAILVAKEWLLDFNIGVFWVMMRVLACGGLGVLVWEARTGQLLRKEGQHVEVSKPQNSC